VGIPESIPEWVKDNASGWADGSIDESNFISGIKHMVDEKIIYVPELPTQTSDTSNVPDWIKNNAKWWTDGSIDEDEFVNAMKYLINQKILIVN